MSSSPEWVLAATQTGRFCRASCNSFRADASALRGGASSFRLPTDTMSFSPNSCQRCAVMSSCASSMSKQPNRARAEFFARRQNLKDFSESRPLMRVAGILRRRISSNRFGHNSLSTNIANCGDQWSRKRFTQSGRSSGKYWCVSRSISGKLACFNWPTSVAEVRVPVVMRICVSGRAAKKSASKGKAERVSPTDAA